MAAQLSDSMLDHPSSCDYFMTWARSMTNNVPSNAVEVSPNVPSLPEGAKNLAAHVKPIAVGDESVLSKPVEFQKPEGVEDLKVDTSPESVQDHSTIQDAIKPAITNYDQHYTNGEALSAQPVVSVAYKPATTGAPLTLPQVSRNLLDDSPVREGLRSLATMTPTQARLVQKLEPHRIADTSLPLVVRSELPKPGNVVVPMAADNSMPFDISQERRKNDVPVEERQSLVTAALQRGRGLSSSIHAKYSNQQSKFKFMQPQARIAPAIPSTTQDHSSVIQPRIQAPLEVKECKHHDAMEYFETKRQEYYPPDDSPKVPDRVLQNKDPNISTKVFQTSKVELDPYPEEMKLMPSDVLKIVVSNKQENEHASSCINSPDMLETPVVKTENGDPENNPPPSESGVHGGEQDKSAEPAKPECDQSTTASIISPATQDGAETKDEKELDMSPMLNMLGSRVGKESKAITHKHREPQSLNEKDWDIVQEQYQGMEGTAKVDADCCTILIENLPREDTISFLRDLVLDIPLVSLKLLRTADCACIKFACAEDCQRMSDSLGNKSMAGQASDVYKVLKVHIASSELSFQIGKHDEDLRDYLNRTATPTVQIDGVDLDLTMRALYQLGSGDPTSRKVDSITDSFREGLRRIVFHFTNVSDAVGFRASLREYSGWKDKQVEFI